MKTLELDRGLSIYIAAEQAVKHAKETGECCQFFFNQIQLIVYPDYNADQLALEYNLRHHIKRLLWEKK